VDASAEWEREFVEGCSEAAAKDHQNIVSVASALRSRADGDDDPARAVVAALEYHFVVDADQRREAGPFGPMIETEKGSYPAPVRAVERLAPGTLAVWERALEIAPVALVRGRLADLLWEARFGDRPHEFAQRAIDGYLEAIDEDFGHAVEVSEAVQRAVELASMLNDQERRKNAVDAAVRLVWRAIDDAEDRMPGVALPLLEMFVSDRPDRRPAELADLVERSIERFGDDPWNLESALELKAKLVSPEERSALRTREAEAFRDLAHRSEGLVKYAHLQHAIELAEGYGLDGLADEIRHEVEHLTEDDLDLKVISTEVSLPREQVEEFVRWFVGDDDIESALARFGSYVPTGDTDENRAQVERLMSDHPLQYLFNRMQIGPENSLLHSTASDDDKAERALVDYEAQGASIFSLFAVDILVGIRDRYGAVSGAGAWFESELIETSVASRVARAVELYEDGDFDSCASVMAPRLERVVRRLAGLVGLTVTRSPDRRGRSGGVKGLAELLGKLTGAMPEPTRRYLKVLLVEVTGLNLRNRVGHGLDDEIAQREAALLIHCACHLRILVPAEDE